jgi:leader peptidase (prepilin peptidase)/N-methyltransferase
MTGNILALLTGLAVGSLLNVIIIRLSQDEPFWSRRLRCGHCQQCFPRLGFVLPCSSAWGGGRCRNCGEPLAWRYPVVEAAAGALALALWWRFPGSSLLWLYGPFAAALLILTVLDLQYFWLPDVITLPGLTLGLAAALVFPDPGLRNALLGAALGWAFFRGVRWLYEKVSRGHRQGVGAGDAKLTAFIGAVLGVKALPWVLMSSATLGSLAGFALMLSQGRDRFSAMPYGPFLALGALLFLFMK